MAYGLMKVNLYASLYSFLGILPSEVVCDKVNLSVFDESFLGFVGLTHCSGSLCIILVDDHILS